MSSLRLVANKVLLTNYGHLQFVYDPDEIWNNGDELELEVQGPFLAIGDWDVRPVQPFDTPSFSNPYLTTLSITDGRSVDDIWGLLVNARNFFATQSIDYQLGITGTVGQNSNTYITTLSHIAGVDIAAELSEILTFSSVSSLPGVTRNVLFSHIDSDGDPLAPIGLTLDGTTGIDHMAGGNNIDVLAAGAGDDRIVGYGGNDVLNGEDGDDVILGGDGRDTALGGSGADQLFGDAGNDFLYGLDGDDELTGGTGYDRLFGGLGDDELFGESGNDRLNGGQGEDVLNGNNGDDILTGGAASDVLNGQWGDDLIFGGGGFDRINGGAGDDDLSGGGGADRVSGGDGADSLSGQAGNDILTGGADADVFVFDGLTDEGSDRITDFELGIDLIAVSGLTFGDIGIGGTTDAQITLDGLTVITLNGVAAADVGMGVFDFV